MASLDRLQSFLKGLFELNNAIVENPKDDVLEVLLPPALYKNTPFNEYERFYFNGDLREDGGKFISYHTDIFDSFSSMLGSRGYISIGELPVTYLKNTGFEEAIENRLVFTNGIFRFQKGEEKKISYLFINFSYTAVSEDKKEGIVQQAVNEYTMASIDWPCPVSKIETGRPSEKSIMPLSIKGPFQRASITVQNKVSGLLVEFEKKLNHHLNRDILRLNDYYGTIESEIRKKIKKKNLTGKEKEKELSRIEATRSELKRKIRDQKDRYKMRVELQPINILRVVTPVMVLSLTLHRKKQPRKVDFVWNPFLKQIEPLSCESCFAPTTVFSFCDDKVHMICKNCESCHYCGKFNCKVCSPDKCRKCGKNPNGPEFTGP